MQQDSQKKFVFNYSQYKSKHISIEKLDQMMEIAMAPATTYLQFASKAVTIIIMGVYVFIRHKLIEEEMMIQKQAYEQRQNNSARTEIDSEDLDHR